MFSENISRDEWLQRVDEIAAEMLGRPRLRAFEVRSLSGVDDGSTFIDVGYPNPLSSGGVEPEVIVAAVGSADFEEFIAALGLHPAPGAEPNGPRLDTAEPQPMTPLLAAAGVRAWHGSHDGAQVVVIDRARKLPPASEIGEVAVPGDLIRSWAENVRLA